MLKIKQITGAFSLLFVLSVIGYAQKTPKVDFAKKISEATPQPLPQEPVAVKLKSDAQDKNLKGKVKSVTKDDLDLKTKKREREEEEYYNEAGNLTKGVSYDAGYPSSVTVWGYIDGQRVLKNNFISFSDAERPPSTRMTIIASAEDNPINRNLPKDTRYSVRKDYKYNEKGQLIEEVIYNNNRELWSRTVNNYKGNQREVLNYDKTNSQTGQTIEILDKDGNIIERDLMDENGKVGDKEINTYEFDSQGNWIVEKTFEEKKVRGKVVRKLLWTTLRTITYYQ
jgi:hypothetical protein